MSINYNDEKRDPVTNFSDFIRNGTYEEKKKVYLDVMGKAVKQQTAVVSEYNHGGYLIPETIKVFREGLLAKICRVFNHSYGWVDFRLADSLRARVDKLINKQAADAMGESLLNGDPKPGEVIRGFLSQGS